MTETRRMYAVQQMATESAILTATSSPNQDMIEQVNDANLVLRTPLFSQRNTVCSNSLVLRPTQGEIRML